MKITYYGTAAAEGWPGLFCRCPVCEEARRLRGKNIRTRSETLINDDLLVDMSADNYMHALCYGLDLTKVRGVLFTHSHSDHCYPWDLEYVRDVYSHTYAHVMQIYGNDAVKALVEQALGTLDSEEYRVRFHELEANRPVKALDYDVMPLRATHARNEKCLFYRIERDGKRLLYAHDTGVFTEENFETLSSLPGRLDLVSLDCTSQKHRDGNYHMGLMDAVEQKEKLIARGLADEHTVWVVNHFSHNGGWLHEEIEREAGKYGILAAYDGMSIDF